MANVILKNNVDFLKENFPLRGASFCAEKLGVSEKEIRVFCNYKKIKRLEGYKGNGKTGRLFREKFEFIDDPFVVYFLGFIWADGHFGIKNKSLSLEIVSDDAKNLEFIIDKVGEPRKRQRQRTKNGKLFGREQTCFSFSVKDLSEFFTENEFHLKSSKEPSRILDKIPDNLRHYFWRGFFDGDGNLYLKHKYEFSFWGPLTQSWVEIIKVLDSLEIKYHLRRDINRKEQSYSQLYCCNLEGINKFNAYISQGIPFGLERKRLIGNLTDRRKAKLSTLLT